VSAPIAARWLAGIVIAGLLLAQVPPRPAGAQAPARAPGEVVAGELIVRFQPGTPGAAAADLHRRYGGQLARRPDRLDAPLVRVPPGRVPAVLAR
jgi:hypothetical protein